MSKWHWSVWLKGLGAAVVSGASSGLATALALPDAVNANPWAMLKVGGINALLGGFLYLKQSPVPLED